MRIQMTKSFVTSTAADPTCQRRNSSFVGALRGPTQTRRRRAIESTRRVRLPRPLAAGAEELVSVSSRAGTPSARQSCWRAAAFYRIKSSARGECSRSSPKAKSAPSACQRLACLPEAAAFAFSSSDLETSGLGVASPGSMFRIQRTAFSTDLRNVLLVQVLSLWPRFV